MTGQHLGNIMRKEWRAMASELNSLLLVTLLPLLILGQGILLIWLVNRFGGEAVMANNLLQHALNNLMRILPAAAALAPRQQLQLLLLSQFNFYLMAIPMMIAVSFATFSIVDEKLSGSLEALLATPVKTWVLLLGKTLSGAIPALLITWLCGIFFILAIVGLGWGELVSMVLSPSWYISLFLFTPAIAVLSFLLGVIASSRARDARNAQSIVVLIYLPLLGLIILQVTGVVWFGPLPLLLIALGLCILELCVLRGAVKLFRRESIIVSWR